MPPDEQIVRQVLAKHDRGNICREAVEKAWNTVQQQYPGKVWWRRKSTRAALMWEHSVDNAVSALSGLPGVKILSHHDTTSFVFDQTVLLRFKKANIQLQTANYPTLLASLFFEHNADLFGFRDLHRVELAHVLNRFETGVEWVGVVARDDHRVLWHFEIGGDEAIAEMLPPPKPLQPAGDRVVQPTQIPDPKTDEAKGEE